MRGWTCSDRMSRTAFHRAEIRRLGGDIKKIPSVHPRVSQNETAGAAVQNLDYIMSRTRLEASYLPRWCHAAAERIVSQLVEWFAEYGRSFPWRSEERSRPVTGAFVHNPYEILVSEMMLQQTQAGRVVAKLPEFLERFPTVESLAEASRAELLRAWQGMGYNRRALRLREIAALVVERYGGTFPASVAELESLPGIGRYTAAAVACFAFGLDVPVVDVNVHRVLSRIFFRCHTAESTMPTKTVDRVAEAIVPVGDAYRWHQALMDLGATICTARDPACARCPLAADCLSAFLLPIRLFAPSDIRRPEPSLRGVPRRLWRGRMIEALRRVGGGTIRLGELIDQILPSTLLPAPILSERRAIVEIAAVLLEEGMIVRPGVREGGLGEADTVALPE